MTERTTARVVGALFIVATGAGLLGIVVAQPVLDAGDYLTEVSRNPSSVATGALLELVMGLAVAAIAVAIYPVLRRVSERAALGYIVARTAEGMLIILGAIAGLTLLSLSRDVVGAGTPDPSLLSVGDTLLAVRDGVYYAVLPIVFGLSAVILNSVLYQARLMPRWLSGWGLVGAVLFFATGPLVMYGVEPSALTVLAAPIGLQEMAFAAWLIVRGIDAAALTSTPAGERAVASRPA